MEVWLTETFTHYAYQPYMVYGLIVLLMTASSFGLPIPEEFTLVTVGFIAYTARFPETYPPPTPNAVGINMYVLAIVSLIAVLSSDVLVYSIGRFFGKKLMSSNFFKKKVKQERFDKINLLFQKYSGFAIFGFRFMPGIRFPGHLTCGMTKVPLKKFLSIDGLAASISVPTQVLVVAIYGKVIISTISKYKYAFFGTLFTLFLIFVFYKYYQHKKNISKSSNQEKKIGNSNLKGESEV